MIQNRIRDDIHTQRLLLIEFQKMEFKYNQKNKILKARSVIPYERPVYITNLKKLLTSSVVSNGQGLLDFWIPEITKFHCKRLKIDVVQRNKNENCLEWIKYVLSKKLKDNFKNQYDFGGKEYQRLKTFYEIRNYQVHSGGYLTDEKQEIRLNRESGISIDSCELFSIDYLYCEDILDNIEHFLITLIEIV